MKTHFKEKDSFYLLENIERKYILCEEGGSGTRDRALSFFFSGEWGVGVFFSCSMFVFINTIQYKMFSRNMVAELKQVARSWRKQEKKIYVYSKRGTT